MTIDSILLVVTSTICGMIIGILAGYFVILRYLKDKIQYYKDYSEELEARLKEWKGKYYGIQGNEVRKEKNERFMLAMNEFIALTHQGTDFKEALKQVATKYPDVAMEIMKKQSNIKL